MLVLAPGDDGRLEDIIIESVMSSNGPCFAAGLDAEAAASLLVRVRCQLNVVLLAGFSYNTITSFSAAGHDALFSATHPLIQLTHGPQFRENLSSSHHSLQENRPCSPLNQHHRYI